MSKYLLLSILVLLLIFTTYIVDVSEGYSTTSEINETLDEPDSYNRVTVWSMAKTFLRILSFQVVGFPPILNLLLFYPITIIVGYMLIDVILDLIPL